MIFKNSDFIPKYILGHLKVCLKVVPIKMCQKVFCDEIHNFVLKNYFWDEVQENHLNTFELNIFFGTNEFCPSNTFERLNVSFKRILHV